MKLFSNQYDLDQNDCTQPIVCRSHAGFYIGTLQLDRDLQVLVPYERLSDSYWATEEEASLFLPAFI